MYQGGFERNFPNLKPGTTTFQGTDGGEHPVPVAPPTCDGARFYSMEEAGKKFAAVRVQHGQDDVVVKNEILLDQGRHLWFGVGCAPEPNELTDESEAVNVEELMVENHEQKRQLAEIRGRFSVTGKAKPKLKVKAKA